jgi:hypothetical protein
MAEKDILKMCSQKYRNRIPFVITQSGRDVFVPFFREMWGCECVMCSSQPFVTPFCLCILRSNLAIRSKTSKHTHESLEAGYSGCCGYVLPVILLTLPFRSFILSLLPCAFLRVFLHLLLYLFTFPRSSLVQSFSSFSPLTVFFVLFSLNFIHFIAGA